jgi:hypothetical protein
MRQFGDELRRLCLRETAPIWLTQEADQFVVMRTSPAAGDEIFQ